MVMATCFDDYEKNSDNRNKTVIVTRLVKKLKKLNSITTTKKIFPGYHKPVWAASLTTYAKIVQYLALHNKRFQRHADLVTNTFMDFLSGDQRMHAAIDANAASNHILNQMAREEVMARDGGGAGAGAGAGASAVEQPG
eukprot:1004049-Rhodomonas_salina.1